MEDCHKKYYEEDSYQVQNIMNNQAIEPCPQLVNNTKVVKSVAPGKGKLTTVPNGTAFGKSKNRA